MNLIIKERMKHWN